jgi:hypothetical protein
MRKLIAALAGMVVLLLIALVAAAIFIGPSLIKDGLERGVSQAPTRKLSVQAVRLRLMPLPGIELANLEFEDTQLRIRARVAQVAASVAWTLDHVELAVQQPDVQLVAADAAAAGTPGGPPASGHPSAPLALPALRPFSLSLAVDGGQVTYWAAGQSLKAEAKDLSFRLAFDRIEQPWKITLSARNQITQGTRTWSVPARLELTLAEPPLARTRIQAARITLAGIPFELQGEIDNATLRGSVALQTRIEDFARLAAFYPPLAQQKLSGALTANLRAANLDGRGWLAEGQLGARAVRGSPDLAFPGGRLRGPVALDAQVDFKQLAPLAAGHAPEVSIPHATVQADLSAAELQYESYLHKQAGVPLRLDLDGASRGQTLELKRLHAQLGQIQLEGSGQASLQKGAVSQLAFRIPSTSLAGLERNFPPLAAAPLQGTVELSAQVHGDLANPLGLSVAVNPLRLSGIRGRVDWRSPDQATTVRGPVALDAQVNLVAEGPAIRTAQLSARAALSGLDIQKKGLFGKPAGAPLELALAARQKGDRVDVTSAALKILSSQLTLSGHVSQPQRPRFDLTLRVPRYTYQDLSILAPMLARWKLRGVGQGQFRVAGTYDFAQGVTKSPIRVSGQARTTIEEITLPAPAPLTAQADGAKAAAAPVPPVPIEPRLPDWPVLRTLDVASQGEIKRLRYGDLTVQGVKWNGGVRAGALHGQGQIARVFGGSASFQDLAMSLTELQPDTRLKSSFKGIDVNQMATWLAPPWKDLVRGRASGAMTLLVPHASRPDFAQRTQVQGRAQLAGAHFSTVPLEQLVNESLSRIPKIGEQARLKGTGVAGDLDAKFQLRGGRMELDPFHMKMPNRTELLLKGSLGMDLGIDLAGMAYLADPPVGGLVLKANSDPQGRLMIPFELKGKLNQPSVSFAAATLQQIALRTAKYELDAQKQKAVERAKATATNAVKQGLGKLFRR